MPQLRRLGAAIAAAAALAALMTGPALAGGSATVTIVEDGGGAPIAGEEREIRFSLLQHGVTPVDFGSAQLLASLAGSDEQVRVDAINVGDGEWITTVTFPIAGDWSVRVGHSDLATPPPTTVAVDSRAGLAWLPGALAIGTVLLVVLVLVGASTLLDRRRPAADPADPAVTAVRAG